MVLRKEVLKVPKLEELKVPPEEPLVVPEVPIEEFIAPPREPITPELGDIYSAIERLYPERIEKLTEYGWAAGEMIAIAPTPDVVVEDILGWAETDMGEFLVDLYERTDPATAESLLRLMGQPEEVIQAISGQFIDIEAEEARVGELVTDVFPDLTPEEFIAFVTDQWDLFILSIQEMGRTKETQDLLRLIGFEWEDIGEIFKIERVFMEVDGVRTLVAIDVNERGIPLVKDSQGRVIGEIDSITGDVIPYQYRIGDTWMHFTAGVGDTIVTSGGALKWLGEDEIGERLSEFGEFLQLQAPPDTLGEFEWNFLYNPRFYATRVTRTLPFTLVLIPAMIAGKYAALAVATRIGLGKFATFILEAIGAAAFSRPIESALEAGGVYDRAIDKGLSEAEARKAATSTFVQNLTLVGLDAAQFAIAFAPLPTRTFTNLIVRGLVTTARIGGRLTITGLSEAGEEFYQEIIQRVALGEDVRWDAEMKEVVAIGGIIGIGFGTAGEVWISIQKRTTDAMSVDARTKFNNDVAGFIEQGLDEEQATLAALDLYAETEEGQAVITNIIENERVNAFEKEIKPETEADKLAWEQTFEQMREEITPIPEVVPEAVRTLPLEEVSKLETRVPLDLIRKDEGVEIARLTREIQEEGITEPITIRVREDGSQIVWDGLHRLIVAQDLGIKNIPIQFIGEVEKLALKPLVKPEVWMTQEIWGGMVETSRAKAVREVGLGADVAMKTWEELTSREKNILGYEAPVKVPMVAKLPAVTEEIIGLPPTTELVSQGIAENTQGLSEITAKEEFRPSRQVFIRMGIWRDFYKPMQRAEVLLNEEKQVYSAERKETNGLLSKEAERRALVWDEVNKKGSVVGLTFDEKRAVTRIREWADRWAERKNLPLAKRVDNYIPHLFEEEMIRQIKEENGIDPVLARILSEEFAGKITDPFLKQRLGKEIGLLKDPIACMEAYDNVSLRVIHYAPLLNKLNAYMTDPNIPEGSREYLRNYARRLTGELSKSDIALNKMIGEFASKLRTMPKVGEGLYALLTKGNPAGIAAYNLTSALYMLWLGFKPTSAIRNLSQHTLILAETGPISFSEAIAKTATEESKSAVRESIVTRARQMAFLPGIDSSFVVQWTAEFGKVTLAMFRGADWVNVRHAFLAGYYEAKRLLPNADRQVWIDRGDEVAANTQYQYTKMNSMAFAQNAPGRVLSMLTTWAENWVELIAKWVKRTPSQVYLEYERQTGIKVARANWSTSYKAILLYMLIVGIGFAIKERTRLKAWEYTGITSVRYLADIAGGDFPALQAPGGVMKTIVGFLTDDERMLKEGLYELRTTFTPAVVRQIESVMVGDKDWLTLFFYLEGKNYLLLKLKDDWEEGWENYPIFEDAEARREYVLKHRDYEGLTDAKMRIKWREDNPLLEAQMFVTSQFTTLSTDEARTEVLRLIEKHDIDTELIDGYDKVFGVDTKAELQKFQDRIGNLEKLVIGEEAKYFTTSNYLTQVNAQIKISGLDKVYSEGSPFTRFAIESQNLWEAYYNLGEGDARILWRQQFPDLEASLYLFGKVSSFKNPQSAEVLLNLMRKYDILPQAIQAFIDKPERYDELFTPIFELKQKWYDESTEYENYGNSESPLYVEDADERARIRQEFKDSHPEWVAGMRSIEAYENEATEDIVSRWVERGQTIDEFGAGSSEAKVWLLNNPEVHKWALDNELLTDDGVGWNEPVLRINVKWYDLDKQYEGFGDKESEFYIADDSERAEARESLLATNEEYRLDVQRRDAYRMEFPEGQIENYVAYYELGAKGFEQERMLLDNPAFAKSMHELVGIDLPERVPSAQYDEIYKQFKADFDKLEGLSDHESPFYIENVEARDRARYAMRFDEAGNLTEFGIAEIRRNGYGKFVPEKHIENYVAYYSIITKGKPEDYEEINKTNLWYEDDWVLMNNPEFYKEVYLDLLGNEPKNFSKVPTREVFAMYLEYVKLPQGKRRQDYRYENPKLDAWGVLKFGWTPITEQMLRAELTPTEEFLEDVLEKETEFDEAMRELEDLLEALK